MLHHGPGATMLTVDRLSALLDGGYLIVGALIAALVGALGRSAPHRALALGFVIALSWRGEPLGTVSVLALGAVGLSVAVERRQWPSVTGQEALIAMVLSATASAGIYACVPDTEMARALAGATGGAAVVALLRRTAWAPSTAMVSGGVAAIALIDGWARPSAVVGGLGIAVVHAVVQAVVCRRWATSWLVLAVGVAGISVSSRAAGLGSGTARPVAEALLAAVGGAVVLVGPAVRRRDRHPVMPACGAGGDGSGRSRRAARESRRT